VGAEDQTRLVVGEIAYGFLESCDDLLVRGDCKQADGPIRAEHEPPRPEQVHTRGTKGRRSSGVNDAQPASVTMPESLTSTLARAASLACRVLVG
jgi:hypothetical protein